MLECIILDERSQAMRTTITIDDELFRKAVEVANPGMDKAEIVREAMRMFVRIQSGKRLAALGGTAPRMRDVPRRRAAGRTVR